MNLKSLGAAAALALCAPLQALAGVAVDVEILDRATGQILYGRVPAGSVVVSGTLPSPDGKYGLYCAVIVKKVDAKTRAKTSLNELLRGD